VARALPVSISAANHSQDISNPRWLATKPLAKKAKIPISDASNTT
jgi:hypothetical protein